MGVAVLFGGRSGEHEVSIQSASSVVRNLDKTRYRIVLIGIGKDGRWFLQPPGMIETVCDSDTALSIEEDPTRMIDLRPGGGLFLGGERIAIDVVFPVLHGSFGEDGTVQGALDIAGLPYVGSGVLGSAAGMDKDAAKRLWSASGIPVVPSMTVHRRAAIDEAAVSRLFAEARDRWGTPIFVKPARAGSSVGVARVEHPEEFRAALLDAFRFDTKLLLEPAIDGQEIEVSVVGNAHAHAYPPGEVIPTHQFYDYDAKYRDPNGAALQIPARLSESEADAISRYAAAAHESVGAEGMSRVDFFISRTDRKIYVNEINTIPGFTRISMFPRMCAAAGLSYPELLSTLIDLALDRAQEQGGLVFDYQCS
ncbi:MAG: D-alanine--D-alanine ligase [Spirochaetaceae bacterium]|nr:MAG: D-alanine--D-alanine ligase [Spirochaetaceae bacterium]